MTYRITPGQIRKTNRQMIYDFIYKGRKVSQQDIAYSLRLSRPTVTSNLCEMEAEHLVAKNGLLNSNQIGRKATAYSIVPDSRVAVGVNVTRRAAKVIAIDLYGEKIDRIVLERPFEDQHSYYREISEGILKFIASLDIADARILGVGFAMPGLVSADGRSVVYGKILDCTGLTVDVFTRWLNYPCTFIHDMDGAALSELWSSPELSDAVYISLDRHVGGSFISERQIKAGKHGHSATFEHIQARQDGKLCYCGKRGCYETICSMEAFLGDRDPDDFFRLLRARKPTPAKRWKIYLTYLAQLMTQIRLVTDVDIILGGRFAPYFTEEDIQFLYDEIRRRTPFTDTDDYILISKMPSHNVTVGAALPYIRGFLEDIGPGRRKPAPADDKTCVAAPGQ